jgi:hypothetical protein
MSCGMMVLILFIPNYPNSQAELGGNYHFVDFKAADGSVIDRKYSDS